MKDIQINTFEKGMQKDLGPTVAQPGSYSHAENIRILSDGSVGENAVAVSVNGNREVLHLTYEYEDNFTFVFDDINVEGEQENVDMQKAEAKIIGYANLKDSLIIFAVAEAENLTKRGLIYKVDPNGMANTVQGTVTINSPVPNTELIYESTELNFDINYPIHAVGRYETDNIQRVYWTDNLNPVRTINVMQEDLMDVPVIELGLNIPVSFSSPEIQRVNFSGSLPAGMYQYAYRLKTNEGAVTRFSPLSNFTHVVAGSKYWDYQEDPENQTEYSNTTPGELTDKAVVIDIKNIDTDYDLIELAAIYKTAAGAIQNCYIVESSRVVGVEQTFIHRNDAGVSLLLEEVTEFTNIPSKVKTITTKDNRLFLGNIQYSQFNLEFNARAYRFKRPDNVRYPRISIDETITQGQMTTYVDHLFDPLEGTGSENYTLQENLDAINPYNNISSEQVPEYQTFKFQKDGITLGGEGPNISYEFIKRKLDGNNARGNYYIPEEAPFVSAPFKGQDKVGDYKDPYNVSTFLGYRRDEIYRFGIVLYDLEGNPGFVNWIGDIRFPSYEDYDYKNNEGIYNYTLAQVFNPTLNNSRYESGTNYVFNNPDPNQATTVNAYEFMDLTFPNQYYGQESQYDNSNINFNDFAGGEIFALGIKFTVNIPSDIQDKISGYKIVRVERTDVDKTVLGTGMVNYMQDIWNVPGQYIYTTYTSGGTSDTPLGYNEFPGTSGQGVGSYPNRSITIDSPDFTFGEYPIEGDTYLQVIGVATGRREHDFNTDSTGNAYCYSSHKLGLTEDSLFKTYEIDFSAKLDVGESLQIPGFELDPDSNYLNDSNMGVYNIEVNNGTSDDHIRGVGEETFFIRLKEDSQLDYADVFINSDADLGAYGNGKLLASIRKTRANQYGGNTNEQRKNNSYISAGPFIRLDGSGNLDEDGAHDVWGGDTYLTIYDIEKTRRATSSDVGIAPPSMLYGSSPTTNTPKSTSFAFPVESSFNTTLRGGWHFANKTDFSLDTTTPLNTFDLASCYSSENTTEIFIPKPFNFVETSIYSNRVIYSDAKISGEKQDSWRKFRLESYEDVDGLYGDVTKLIVNNDLMYYLQTSGFGKLSINPVSTVVDQNGASIVLGTGSVIQDVSYISTDVGCSNIASAVSSPAGIYWFDANKKKAYAFRANGLESISDTHGVKSWFSNMYQSTAGFPNSVTYYTDHLPDVTLGYDYLNNEVLYSLCTSAVNYSGQSTYGSTIAFSERINKFTSIYPYYTPMYMMLPNKLLSVFSHDDHRGQLYAHNLGSIGRWFINSHSTKIEFIVNKNPLFPKAFDHIEWYVSKNHTLYPELGLMDNFDKASFRVSAPAELVVQELRDGGNIIEESEFDVRENISRMPVPRNSFGERMRDTFMKVVLEQGYGIYNNKISLHYVKTLFRISRR